MGETSKHTPAPWRYHPYGPEGVSDPVDNYRAISSGDGFFGAPNGGHGFDLVGYMSDADGRLIAAAPELLAALKEWVEGWNGFSDFETSRRTHPDLFEQIKRARAAIAKAEPA